MADSSQHELWYVEEVTRGVTPTTPAWSRVRDLSCTLGLTKNTATSEENRGDRQIRHIDHTTRSVDGDIGTYLFYGDNDDLLEAALCGTWAADTPSLGTDQLKVGVVRRSFSFMRVFNDLSVGSKTHHIYSGVELTSFSLGVTPDGYISMSLSCIGSDLSLSTAAPAGSTYPSNLVDSNPMEGTASVILEGGVSAAIITEYSPSLENGMETRFAIGSAVTRQPTLGNSNSAGSITAFFEDTVLYEKFLNETSSSIAITGTDADGNSLQIIQPNIIYTGGRPDTAAEGDILVTLPYQAIVDGTESTNVYFERTVAPA